MTMKPPSGSAGCTESESPANAPPADALPYLSAEAQAKALAEFLARHVTPYDPETDDYERAAFFTDVVSPGRSDFYNFHYYLTKVPPESISVLVQHYTNPGDVVLDPFCGSGMTGVAVQNASNPDKQRYCILNDLSPAACHIARNYTRPVSEAVLMEAFSDVSTKFEDKATELYSTYHFEPLAEDFPALLAETAFGSRGPGSGSLCDRPGFEVVCFQAVRDFLGYDPPAGSTQTSRWLKIPATILFVVWSDVYLCKGFKTTDEPTGRTNAKTGKPILRKKRVERGCGNEIIARGTNDKHSGDGNNAFLRCPHCAERWMKGRIPRVGNIPVEEHYEYVGLVSKAGSLREKVLRAFRPISKDQLRFIESIRMDPSVTNGPNPPADKDNPRYRRDALLGKRINWYRDFFTPRNYRALSELWLAIASVADPARDALRFCLTSQLMRCSRLRRMKGDKAGEQLSGTLHIASETVETNVWRAFKGAAEKYAKSVSKGVVRSPVPPFVRNGSATNLHGISDNSVDYIFADPPFGSNIYYSGVNYMWEAWLGRFTEQELEAVMHRPVDGGHKRLTDYARLIGQCFQEMFRVLKPGRFATIEFNNSDGEVFQVIRDGLTGAGFAIENMLLFDKVARTFAQIRSTAGISEVVDKDVLFNVRKPTAIRDRQDAHDSDAEIMVADAVRDYLLTLPSRIREAPEKYTDDYRTTATINSMLMNALIPRGVNVEQLNLPFIERVCSRYFRKIGQHWYLRGEAVGGNGSGGLFDEEVIINDSLTGIDWLRQKLRARAMLVGELKPLWMRAVGLLPAEISQSLDLEELLSENFWRDEETNRWREPTADERERMNDDRSARVLHDAERYLSGNLRRQTTDDERADWIDVLFKACRQVEEGDVQATPALRNFDLHEGFRLITRLFQSMLSDHVGPDVFARAKKQAGIASNRISQAVRSQEEKRAAERKRKEPSLFD